jgi:hypothetical protein
MKSKGFALLYTILIISIIVTLSVGTSNLVSKERRLSLLARQSLNARSAADAGMECMLYNDKLPTQFDPSINPGSFSFVCGIDSGGNPIIYNSSFGGLPGGVYWYTVFTSLSTNDPCFNASITRDMTALPPSTVLSVSGYNFCDINSPSRVERGIVAEY